MTDYEKVELEIYFLFREYPGALSAISGNLKRNDSSKLSRQLNPSDDRRDNPFTEVLEILIEGAIPFSPALAADVWQILFREWSKHQKDEPAIKAQLAELMEKIFDELKDVSTINFRGGSKADWEKESFELLEAAKQLYEKVKQWKDE